MIDTLSRDELIELCRERFFSEREILSARLAVAEIRARAAWDDEDRACARHSAAVQAMMAAGRSETSEIWIELQQKSHAAAANRRSAVRRRERLDRHVKALRLQLSELSRG